MLRRHARLALLALLALLAALALVPAASAAPYLPPAGKIFHGVTAGQPGTFDAQTHQHSPVFQQFVLWDFRMLSGWAFDKAAAHRSRLALALSTSDGNGAKEVISPGAVARGDGDGYLRYLGRRIAQGGRPVYLRLFSEMDGSWNAYCAFNANGSRRNRDHSTAAFKRAWRRVAIVLRGGPRDRVDQLLAAQHLPPLRGGPGDLPQAPVALLWVPQVAGAPDVRGNQPRDYWPGARWVDWVGTDFYARFPNFAGLERLYADRRFASKPFVFGEWALWGADDPGFVRRLFGWVSTHRRVRMMLYNQGYRTNGPFRINRYPAARAELRRQLASPRFAPLAPDYR